MGSSKPIAETERSDVCDSLGRYEQLVANSRDIILSFRRDDGCILEANAAARKAYGYGGAELLAMTVQDLRAPDTRRWAADQVGVADEQGLLFETVHRRKDGSAFPVEVSTQGSTIDGTRILVSVVRDITERKRVEESLREQLAVNDQLVKSMSNMPGAIFSYRLRSDGSACVPFATLAMEDLLGISRDVLAKDMAPWAANVHPDDIEQVNHVIAEAARTMSRWHDAYRYVHPTKGLRWIEGWTSPVAEPDGSILWHGYASDVTERRRAEEELQASESRLRAFVESDVIGILFGDVEGRVYDCNQELARIIGRSREDVLAGRVSWVDITPPEDLPLDVKGLAEAAETGHCRPYEKHYLRPDGTSVPVQVGYVLLEPERRKSVAYILDISERKRADEALRESEERFRIMADGSPIFLWVTDPQGGNKFVNRRYREFFGMTSKEGEGGSWQPFLHPEDEPKYVEDFIRAVRLRSPFKGAARVRRNDGEWRWVSCRGEPRYSAGGEYLGHVAIALDITDQRRLEEQLQQSQKLESVGRLAGGISHDFNNLLTVILSCAETLKQDVGASLLAQPEVIDEIHAAGKRAAELTRQLLAFARKQVIAPVPLDLNAVVRGSEKLLRRVLGEDVELVVNLRPTVWTVRCDPGQVEQVILNLAINARDAMPSGGTVTIETANAQIDESFVALHPFMRAGPHVRLTVSDSGVGMSPEVQAHVFEPFFTTKPQGKGTGLGLSMVYGIVKQSEGYILLESGTGRGTTFEVYFPRTAAATVQAPAESTTTWRGTETVLVVEDDPQVREVALRALRAGGYRVIAAASGREALEIAARQADALDLLLIDVIMPGLNGREVANELRRRRPGLRVLFMSGYTQDVISKAEVLDSGVEFLPKPFTASVLQGRVRKVLDSR